jgi:hypothetical protein
MDSGIEGGSVTGSSTPAKRSSARCTPTSEVRRPMPDVREAGAAGGLCGGRLWLLLLLCKNCVELVRSALVRRNPRPRYSGDGGIWIRAAVSHVPMWGCNAHENGTVETGGEAGRARGTVSLYGFAGKSL